jgi:seryl-tRNA synthetase
MGHVFLKQSNSQFFLAQYSATQVNTKINEVQKQIGAKKKAKEDASELLQQKIDLEKEKKAWIESAAEKEDALKKKIKTIGNIVHSDVPVNNDEVFSYAPKLRLVRANYLR